MCGKIKLAGHDGNKVVGDRPLVIVFPFIEVHEISCHPKITSAIGIKSLIKILDPLGIGLPTDPNALYGFISPGRNVDI